MAVGGAQILVATATAFLVYAIGARVTSRTRGHDRCDARDSQPVPRLARRASQPGDPRPARLGGVRALRAGRRRSALGAHGRLRRGSSAASRCSATCGCLFLPLARRRLSRVPQRLELGAARPRRGSVLDAHALGRAQPGRGRLLRADNGRRAHSGRRTTSRHTTCSPRASGSTTSRILRVTRSRIPRRRVTSTGRAAGRSTSTSARTQAYYQHKAWRFVRDHPGEKAKLAAQAVRMEWDPRTTASATDSGHGAIRDLAAAAVHVTSLRAGAHRHAS